MRLIVVFILLPAIAGCANIGDSRTVDCNRSKPQTVMHGDSFVGLREPPLPVGIEDLGGFVVQTNNGESNLGVQYIRYKKDTIILLEQLSYQKGCLNPEGIVLDYQRVPKLASNELLLENCRIGDVSDGGDGRTIAIATKEQREILNKIRMSWQVDLKTRKLVAVPPTKVQCINEGFED